jgi:nicotinate-nucleotide--dimethylbenzimidazole phosphoribosyltransferase
MDIPPLDETAMTAAYGASARLGKLHGLGLWLAGVQGSAPPEPLRRRRFVVFGDSVPPAVEALAAAHDVTTHLVTYGPPGPIATAPAATREQVEAAYDAGRALADAEADHGTDVLLVTGIGSAVPAAAIACALAEAEPVETVGHHGTDAQWARDVATVRDALRRSGFRGLDATGLMAELGGEALAAQAGFVAGAARRRTPVVVDGALAAAAALLANVTAPGAVAYVAAAQRSPDPADRALLDALDLVPLLDLGIGEPGLAAPLALAVLDAAVRVARP